MGMGKNIETPERKRILLADDEQAVRHAYAMLLGIDQHEIVEASNGAEALERYSSGTFDVVITDYQMPVMKGNELACRIKALNPSQPIIMITAFEPPQEATNPVDLLVHKPLTLVQLRQAIAQAIQKAAGSDKKHLRGNGS